MHVRNFSRLVALSVLALSACGTADNPYSKIPNPPLVAGRLHTITLVSDEVATLKSVLAAGYAPTPLPPNYRQADEVQASIWGVPEVVAAGAAHLKSTRPGVPDVRLLVMPMAAKGRVAEPDINEAFFRNVLGSEVPAWPLPGAQPANVRVQAWSYQVPDIVAASQRLRGNGIPVIYDPVAITTSYLGDHKTLAIRAPDGTVVQLVEMAAQ
jgi:hypothetical protein